MRIGDYGDDVQQIADNDDPQELIDNLDLLISNQDIMQV